MLEKETTNRIVIRRVKPKELDRALEIYSIAKHFMETHGNLHQWTGDDAVKRESVEKFIRNGQLFAGEENGTLHFCFAYVQGEDPTYKVITDGAWLNDEPYGVVHRLASAGTAGGVVRRVVSWALEQNRNLRIDTHPDNTVMQNALTAAGCTRCGIIYLADGDLRIAYQKIRE